MKLSLSLYVQDSYSGGGYIVPLKGEIIIRFILNYIVPLKGEIIIRFIFNYIVPLKGEIIIHFIVNYIHCAAKR